MTDDTLTDLVARYTAKGRKYNPCVSGVWYRTDSGGMGILHAQDDDERAEIVAGLARLGVETRERDAKD
jgi:hypothetical protein